MDFRLGDKTDILGLVQARLKQLKDEGQIPEPDITEALTACFEKNMADHSISEWIVEKDGEIIATGGLMIIQFSPAFINPVGKTGYICNIYSW